MTVSYRGTGVTLGVYFAPTKGAGDSVSGGDWVDITSYVHVSAPISISRGRGSETDTFSTGSLSLTLLNTDRRFDPEYAAGPYFGNLLPMRPIKVEMVYSATTYTLFRGFIQGWPQSWDETNRVTTVPLVAHDLFKVLALAQLPQSRYVVEVQADAQGANWGWWRLGEATDETVARDSSGNELHCWFNGHTLSDSLVTYDPDGAQLSTVGYSVTAGHAIYAAGLTYTVEAWVDIPAGFAGWLNVWCQGAEGTGVLGFVAPGVQLKLAAGTLTWGMNDGGSTDYIITYAPAIPISGRHHVAGRWDNGTATLFLDGVAVGTGIGTTSAVSSSWGGNVAVSGGAQSDEGFIIDEVAFYQAALSDARILAHYEAGSTVSAGDVVSTRIADVLTDAGLTWITTSIETSDVTCRGADYGGGTSVLAYLQSLERTEQGRLFVAGNGTLTFQNRSHDAVTTTVSAAFTDVAGSTLPYAEADHEYDDTRIRNDVTVSRTNGVAQRVSDSTSVTRYGLRSETVDGLQGQSDTETLNMARYRLASYKDPAARIRSLTVLPRANTAGLMPVVGGLEIGQRVTFRRAPQGGTSFTKTLTVEGITHSIDVGGDWRTTYLTAPLSPVTPGVWDSGTWDSAVWGI